VDLEEALNSVWVSAKFGHSHAVGKAHIPEGIDGSAGNTSNWEDALNQVDLLLHELVVVVHLDHESDWGGSPHGVLSRNGPGIPLGEQPAAVSCRVIVRVLQFTSVLFEVARVHTVVDLATFEAEGIGGGELIALNVGASLSAEVIMSVAAINHTVVLVASQVMVGSGKVHKFDPADMKIDTWLIIVGKRALVDTSLLATIAVVLDLTAREPLLVPIPELCASSVVVDAILAPGDITVTDVVAGVVGLVALTKFEVSLV
jgi:hypothetical protein